MKLIITSAELNTEFSRLMNQYREFYWVMAWASDSFAVSDELFVQKSKISKIAVGIHFYQTAPSFIEKCLNNKKVRFIQQPQGTFHPKVYLFFDSNEKWEAIVGSANFTKAAFSINTEACTLFSSSDLNASETLEKLMQLIHESWENASVFNKKDLKNYEATYEIHKPKIRSLSGLYSATENVKAKIKPIYEVPIINKTWESFIKGVREDDTHGLPARLKVIAVAQQLFQKTQHFKDLSEDERKYIAGVPNNLYINDEEDWRYFGSMQGSGIFRKNIKMNNPNISKALDQIPLSGQITKQHYNNFIEHYSATFEGKWIATATRLLCMKRPDTFVCLDSKNKSALCKDFGISQSNITYDKYWDDIIERIRDSYWWQNPNPKNKEEYKVANARAAFLDSLYYNY